MTVRAASCRNPANTIAVAAVTVMGPAAGSRLAQEAVLKTSSSRVAAGILQEF